jgi:hypothetical protein
MPGLSLRSWATIVSVALLVAVVRIEEGRLAGARQRTGELALEASNVRAERDSTRLVGAGSERVQRLLRDSLQLAERLVIQKTQRQDELDRALRRERIARYSASVSSDSLAAVARGQVTTSSAESVRTVRRASFHIRQVPYTLTAEVALPQAPDTGVMAVQVLLDTMHLEARVGCAAPDPNGIREATVSVTGPRWATLAFERVEHSPELCASPALARERRRSPWPAIAIGTGAVLDPHGRVSWGILVGVGYAFRR